MKRLILFASFLFTFIAGYAQNIAVADFYYDPNDLTARTSGTSRKDQNGNLSALIKVETTEKGLWSFDVGMLGIVGSIEVQNEIHPAEIWVYVPYGVSWITIQHDVLGKLNRYRIPCSIDKGCTYVMKLVTGHVDPVVVQAFTQQYLVFNITPKDAVVTVNDTLWPVIDGVAQKMVRFGDYEYRIEASDYHTEVGRVKVNDPDQKVIKNITLKPAFGYLRIEGDNSLLSGSSIYIDNANGADALKSPVKLGSGQHTVRVIHLKYKPYERTVTITDGETNTLQVNLNANFSTVTLKVDDSETEIWVNNELKGKGGWTGDLEAGNYTIECRKPNHRTTSVKKTVTDNMSGQTIPLQTPIPINGTLVVNSNPPMAKIVIDGKQVGETPMRVNTILIGEHQLRLEKPGCAPLSKTITIEEGKTLSLDEKLDTGRSVLVKTDRKGDKIYVDGDFVGETPYETPLGFGAHTIRVVRNGVKVEKEVTITESSRNGQELLFEFGRLVAISTDQDGDAVMVDGERVGVSPVNVDLPYGSHTIHAERGKKYADKDIEVLKAGGETSHFLRLHGETASHFVKDGVNFATLDFAYSVAPQTSFGATFGSVKKVGWFVTAASNFNFEAMNYSNTADADGLVDGSYYYDYTGTSRNTRLSAMAGLVVKMGGPVYMKLGAGYGSRVKSWYTADGGLVKIADDSFEGVDATAGLLFNLKGFSMSVDAVTTNFKTLELKVGLGFCWKKK